MLFFFCTVPYRKFRSPDHHSSCRSSATHSYWCAQYCCVSRQWDGYQCLGFLTCAQMLTHMIAHGDGGGGGGGHCKRVCTGTWLWEKKPLPHHHRGLKPTSLLCQAFQADALPTELFQSPENVSHAFVCWYGHSTRGAIPAPDNDPQSFAGWFCVQVCSTPWTAPITWERWTRRHSGRGWFWTNRWSPTRGPMQMLVSWRYSAQSCHWGSEEQALV